MERCSLFTVRWKTQNVYLVPPQAKYSVLNIKRMLKYMYEYRVTVNLILNSGGREDHHYIDQSCIMLSKLKRCYELQIHVPMDACSRPYGIPILCMYDTVSLLCHPCATHVPLM